MNKVIAIEITETGFQTLRLLKGYMSAFFNEDSLTNLLTDLVMHTQILLKDVPVRPVCPELALIGIQDYRQLNLMEQYKVLFRYDVQAGKVFVVAFMRQKQSAEKLLVDLALM